MKRVRRIPIYSDGFGEALERYFRDLTVDYIRDGSFASESQLVASIEAYLAERDLAPKHYTWNMEGRWPMAKPSSKR